MSKPSNKNKFLPWVLGALSIVAVITTDIEKILNSIYGIFKNTEDNKAIVTNSNNTDNYVVNGSNNNVQTGNNNSYQNNTVPTKK